MEGLSTALQRIGGPYSVTWFAFWATLVANLVHHLSGSGDLTGNWGLRVVAVLLSQVAMFAVLLTAKATVLRDVALKPRPWTTLACFAVAGLARSSMLMAVLSADLDLSRAQVAQRLVTGVLTLSVYLGISAYLVDLFQQNKRTLALAAASQADLVATRENAGQVLRSQGRQGVEEVRAEIAGHFDARAGEAPSPVELDVFLDETLRPMIRRQTSDAQRWIPPASPPVNPALSLSRVFDSVGLDRPFSPGVQGLLSVMSIVGMIAVLPFGRSLLAMSASFLGPWIMLTLGNRLLRGLTDRTQLSVRAGAVVAWTLISAVVVGAAWGLVVSGTTYVRAGVTAGFFATVFLAAVTVTAKAALTAQRTTESELRQSRAQLRWEVARVRQTQWRQEQQLARALHGPVQTAVIQAAAKPDGDLVALRQRLIDALEEALAADSAPDSLDSVVADVSRSWASVCEVTTQLREDARNADGDALAMLCLSEMLHEAVSNAVRHGGAHNAEIAIGVDGESLRVSVADDGVMSSAARGEGIGSRMLDDCCLAWGRGRTHDRTRLWFLLPAQFGEGDAFVAAVPGDRTIGLDLKV